MGSASGRDWLTSEKNIRYIISTGGGAWFYGNQHEISINCMMSHLHMKSYTMNSSWIHLTVWYHILWKTLNHTCMQCKIWRTGTFSFLAVYSHSWSIDFGLACFVWVSSRSVYARVGFAAEVSMNGCWLDQGKHPGDFAIFSVHARDRFGVRKVTDL